LHRAFVAILLFAFGNGVAWAQAGSTASRAITPSVFAGASGVATGLDSGRNLGITAGIDIAFCPNARLQPSLEYRGMYAINKGEVDSLKNNLAGIKLSKRFGHVQPYADLLAGRGETTYANGGYQVPNTIIFYTLSSSNVYSAGGGADVFTSRRFALKVDLQVQRYSSPVTDSRHLYSETGTIGLVYVFPVGRRIQ
jgi:hypothetical protein